MDWHEIWHSCRGCRHNHVRKNFFGELLTGMDSVGGQNCHFPLTSTVAITQGRWYCAARDHENTITCQISFNYHSDTSATKIKQVKSYTTLQTFSGLPNFLMTLSLSSNLHSQINTSCSAISVNRLVQYSLYDNTAQRLTMLDTGTVCSRELRITSFL